MWILLMLEMDLIFSKSHDDLYVGVGEIFGRVSKVTRYDEDNVFRL